MKDFLLFHFTQQVNPCYNLGMETTLKNQAYKLLKHQSSYLGTPFLVNKPDGGSKGFKDVESFLTFIEKNLTKGFVRETENDEPGDPEMDYNGYGQITFDFKWDPSA